MFDPSADYATLYVVVITEVCPVLRLFVRPRPRFGQGWRLGQCCDMVTSGSDHGYDEDRSSGCMSLHDDRSTGEGIVFLKSGVTHKSLGNYPTGEFRPARSLEDPAQSTEPLAG
jgi:hypothetical protein